MKYKVVCEVTFPIYEITVDVNIPINKTVLYICNMLDKMIIEEIDPNYQIKEDSILVNKRDGKVFDKNFLVKEAGIENGTKLTYF